MSSAKEWLDQCCAQRAKIRHPRASVADPTAEFRLLLDSQPGLRAEAEAIRSRLTDEITKRCAMSKARKEILDAVLA